MTALRDTPTPVLLAEVHHRWSDTRPELVEPLRFVRAMAGIKRDMTDHEYLMSTGDESDAALAKLLAVIEENRGYLGPYGADVTRAAQTVRDLAVRRRAA